MSSKKTDKKNLHLEFPEAPDFISKPPEYTLSEMIKLNEAMLRHWNKKRYEEGSYYLQPIDFEPFSLIKKPYK